MKILVVQHDDDGPAGVVGERIDALGGERVTVLPHRGEALPESPEGFAGAVLLGGAMSVTADDTYPHYRHLFELTRAFHEAGTPILAICLGAQIVARALGERVYRHTETEIGFCAVELTAEGRADPLFAGLGPALRPMQWHEDTFDLPRGAVLLATSAGCRNQAYRVGASTYGVQFHPEVNRAIVEAWGAMPDAQSASGSSDLPRALREQATAHLAAAEAVGRAIAERWMRMLKRG
ncbi:MAG: type 1 glutamine amidotransferase [Byssovorax sp.]